MNERKLTKAELDKREDVIKDMKKNKRALVKRYGKDAEKVMYGRATNIAKKTAESMDQERIKEMVKTALMGPVKEDQVDEANAFVVAADAARDAGKKEFEFPEGSGKMHPVKIKADIDEMDLNDPIAMRMRADKMRAANAGDDGNDKFFAKNTKRLSQLKALKDKRAQIMRDMEQEAEMEGGPIADRYGDMLNKLDQAIAMLQTPEEKEYTLREMSGDKEEGLMELRNIIDEASVLGDQARQVFSQYFPSMLSKAEAYGVFDFVESSNRYDTTLVSMAEEIDQYYDEEDEDMMQEDLDLGHQDNEPHMLKADLYRIGKYAMELYQMVDRFEEGSEEVDFPHWWQSKIIKAKSMLVSAKHYLDFEIKEPQIDAMVDVAQEEDVIDENALGMTDPRLSSDQHRDLDYAVRGDSAYTFGNDPYADDQLRYKYAKKMGFLEENARDKASMAFDKMKVGATIKTSKGEFKKVDDKHFEMVEKPGRKFTAKQMTFIKEENLNEGTWSLGSTADIKGAIDTLEMMLDLGAKEIAAQFKDRDNENFFYNVVGDDLFHDDLNGAKREAEEGNLDRAHNRLIDAKSRAEELLAFVQKREGLNEEDPGEADMVASDIQKAMNKHKKDDAKMHQLQKARTAMNKGDLDKAKKIAARLAEKLKSN